MEQNMNITGLDQLSEPALAALAAIGRLGDADRASVLRMHGLALGPRLWRAADGGDLPTLTRLVPDRDREAVYSSDAWSITYTPVRWLACYMLQTPGLAALSAALGGVGLAKAGTAAVEAVARRVADLGAGEYGAWHRGPQRYERSDGFATYTPAPRLQLSPQHPLSPVRLGLYGPEVGLPAGLSPGRFEGEFNARLMPLRLQSVAGSAVGQDLCARASIDPARLVRFHRSGGRYIAATELTLLRPQADCVALAKVAADIVIDHALGLLPRRSGR